MSELAGALLKSLEIDEWEVDEERKETAILVRSDRRIRVDLNGAVFVRKEGAHYAPNLEIETTRRERKRFSAAAKQKLRQLTVAAICDYAPTPPTEGDE